MKTQALKGMRDLLPAEQTLRDYIQGKILETYRASGFERISTPMLEDMENLDKSDGGDNLNLIFKVLKRGDKLTAALNTGDPKQLSDMGLRIGGIQQCTWWNIGRWCEGQNRQSQSFVISGSTGNHEHT